MSLTVTPVTDNREDPSIQAFAYTPDQLIAGVFPLVTSNATITGGAALVRGTVLGAVTVGTATAAAKAGNTGNGTITGVSAQGNAATGVYKAIVEAAGTNAATWNLYNPNGDLIDQKVYSGSGATAVFANDQIHATITDGATDFVVGDEFDITVVAGSGSYKMAVKTATDGSQIPCAILADDTDASGGDVIGPLYLTGEFNSNAITLDTSFTLAAATAALRAYSIFLKSAVSAADPS
ncbi:MAG: head decoration protein [Alphaproteobacteria bacterium]|nr:head decoration protein [Alphaproteobacteria bacterium]